MLRIVAKFLDAKNPMEPKTKEEEKPKTPKKEQPKQDTNQKTCTKEEAAQLWELLISLRWYPYLDYYRANLDNWERLKAQILNIPTIRQVELFEQFRITEVGTKIQIPVSSWHVIKELAGGGRE
jgi:hypothetical protein